MPWRKVWSANRFGITRFVPTGWRSDLRPGQDKKILEVYARDGHFSMAASQAVGPVGRVAAIDVSDKLLDRLTAKIAKFGIGNIDVHRMDAAPLDFRRDYFHHVVCVLGLDECPDPAATQRAWHRVLVPGGHVMLAVFAATAFEPGAGLFRRQIMDLGIAWPDPVKPFCADAESLRRLLAETGFSEVSIEPEKLGYHLPAVENWWEVVLLQPPVARAGAAERRTA